LVAHPIFGQVQASIGAFTDEPFPHFRIRLSPREAPVAPGDRVAANVRDRRPKLLKAEFADVALLKNCPANNPAG
jgi:hypothetical protein